jgi:hypothetical protein
MQRWTRMLLSSMTYEHCLYGVIMFQSCARGHFTRRWYALFHVAMLRPYIIRLVDCRGVRGSDADGKSDPFVIVTVVKADHDSDGNEVIVDEMERQMYRYDSTVLHDVNARWNETFDIPGSDTNMLAVFTVVDWDETRNDFLGQAVVDLRIPLLYYRRRVYNLSLGVMEIEPRDPNKIPVRLGSMDSQGGGRLTVEVIPVNYATSMCGFLEERMTQYCINGKQYWSVLADDSLSLFGHYGESTPKHVISFKTQATVISKLETDGTVFVIRTQNKTRLFSCGTEDERHRWFKRLSQTTGNANRLC